MIYQYRHGCGNLDENKIRIESIYHIKRCTQSKVAKTLHEDLFNSTSLLGMSYTRETWGYHKEEKTA